MSLKEFDAKQFLLQKGEQVGLGIAVTLMVLMLIFSLFMPSKGFFSGSPVAKAQPLADGAKNLQNKLDHREIPDNYKPADTKGRLIDLDTADLEPRFYTMTGNIFEPAAPENPNRQPPVIFNLAEAGSKALHVDIDSYIFSRNMDGIYVLVDPEGKAPSNTPGGNNPLAKMYGKGMSNMSSPPGAAGSANSMQAAMNRFKGPNRTAGAVQGADGKEEYKPVLRPLESVTMSEHFARQLMPARMVIIAGSFPYKRQLEEFKTKLRLESVQAVLNESMKAETDKDKKEELAAFRFLGVKVQRSEVDANGKTVKAWEDLDLAAPYKIWLMNSSLPFESDDSKYDAVKFDGLVMPRLREFHEESQQKQMGMMIPGMMPGGPGAGPRPDMQRDEPRKSGKSKYPDLAGDLKTINETLDKLGGKVDLKKIARPPSKFRSHENFNPFTSSMPPPPDNKGGKDSEPTTPGDTIPEYCLVRLVDLDIHPGKFYRYRFKVRMANPNYGRDDVASTAYKANPELESHDWQELKETVSLPPESVYYVVDQKQLGKEKPPAESAQAAMWNANPRGGLQVAFQLHRWVESTPIDVKNSEPIPVGEWAIADRVLVARGEFIGQTVKVDLPVWKYTQDSFVLPAEDQTLKKKGKVKTGVSVNFGQENSDTQTILVDFEGGKGVSEGKLSDNSAIEVLMLSPDGKLQARNSSDDANDDTRKDRREEAQRRIKDVREGKSGGAGGGGGLDAGRGK